MSYYPTSKSDSKNSKGSASKNSKKGSGKSKNRNNKGSGKNHNNKNSGGKSNDAQSKSADAALRESSYNHGLKIADNKPVWNFAFGANVNPKKLIDVRKIIPITQKRGKTIEAENWKLCFRHRGGFGTIERQQQNDEANAANISSKNDFEQSSIKRPGSVHGLLLQLQAEDFATLCKMEHQYTPVEITVQIYDNDVGDKEEKFLKAYAFITVEKEFLLKNKQISPTQRYWNLIYEGAKTSKLAKEYTDWLASLKYFEALGLGNQRGAEYYDCCKSDATAAKNAGNNTNSLGISTDDSNAPSGKFQPEPRSQSKGGAKGKGKGSHSTQIRSPTGICVTEKHIYVADSENDKVVQFPKSILKPGHKPLDLNSVAEGKIVAGGNGKGNMMNQLNRPFRICVQQEGKIGTKDENNDVLYIVDRNNNRVLRWVVGEAQGEVVAGNANGASGSDLNHLDQPVAVFVERRSDDGTTDIYVSDRANHRVVKWTYSKLNQGGSLIAGGNGCGDAADQLFCPAGLCIVEDKYVNRQTQNGKFLIVSDEANNRLQAFQTHNSSNEKNTGTTILGSSSSLAGAGLHELYHPLGLSLQKGTMENTKNTNVISISIGDSINYRVVHCSFDLSKHDIMRPNSFVENAEIRCVCSADFAGSVLEKKSEIDKFPKFEQPISVAYSSSDLFVVDSKRVYSLGNQEKSGHSYSLQNAIIPNKTLDGTPSQNQQREGVVVDYRTNSNYGFIKELIDKNSNDNSERNLNKQKYFAHHSDIRSPTLKVLSGYPSLKRGDRVTFLHRTDFKWGQRATKIVKKIASIR